MANSCGILGDGSKAVKIHHLIKAPENTPRSISFRESWDASKPVTVYKTPENLPDGRPCTAVTVILRSKTALHTQWFDALLAWDNTNKNPTKQNWWKQIKN